MALLSVKRAVKGPFDKNFKCSKSEWPSSHKTFISFSCSKLLKFVRMNIGVIGVAYSVLDIALFELATLLDPDT